MCCIVLTHLILQWLCEAGLITHSKWENLDLNPNQMIPQIMFFPGLWCLLIHWILNQWEQENCSEFSRCDIPSAGRGWRHPGKSVVAAADKRNCVRLVCLPLCYKFLFCLFSPAVFCFWGAALLFPSALWPLIPSVFYKHFNIW